MISRTIFVAGALCVGLVTPLLAQEPAAAPAATAKTASATQPAAAVAGPSGTFVDQFGTSFQFSPCGDAGTDLCAVLATLKGESATPENLAFVGKQVMQAKLTAPNEWKGSLTAGGISADATVTQTGPDTVDIQGCRAAVLCKTLAYNRS